jgi:hypothetical protein
MRCRERTAHIVIALRSLLLAAVLAMCSVSPAAARNIEFSGRSWVVKAGQSDDPSAPNRFSADKRSVWVDALGRLHLRLRRDGHAWFSAEVACAQPLGYGMYQFAVDTDAGALDPNVVAGFFTWSDDDAFANREIDIEISRWGDPAAANAQFAVQPYTSPGHLVRFNVPRGTSRATYGLRWEPGTVTFNAYKSATLRTAVPSPGDARAHINIWLAGARPPIDGHESELIVENFVFTPLP